MYHSGTPRFASTFVIGGDDDEFCTQQAAPQSPSPSRSPSPVRAKAPKTPQTPRTPRTPRAAAPKRRAPRAQPEPEPEPEQAIDPRVEELMRECMAAGPEILETPNTPTSLCPVELQLECELLVKGLDRMHLHAARVLWAEPEAEAIADEVLEEGTTHTPKRRATAPAPAHARPSIDTARTCAAREYERAAKPMTWTALYERTRAAVIATTGCAPFPMVMRRALTAIAVEADTGTLTNIPQKAAAIIEQLRTRAR